VSRDGEERDASSQPSGFLPPQAPGGKAAPRFDASAPDTPAPAPDTPAPAPEPALPSSYGGFAPPSEAGTAALPAPPPQSPAGATFSPKPVFTTAQQGNGPAIASFTLGIAGFVMFFVAGFGLIFFLNLPCSIAAWALGPQGVRKVDEGKASGHRELAKAGRVMGIVGTVIGVVAIVAWALLIAFSPHVRHDVDDMLNGNHGDSGSPDNDSLTVNTIVVIRLIGAVVALVA
jgi:hypothetical protein